MRKNKVYGYPIRVDVALEAARPMMDRRQRAWQAAYRELGVEEQAQVDLACQRLMAGVRGMGTLAAVEVVAVVGMFLAKRGERGDDGG